MAKLSRPLEPTPSIFEGAAGEGAGLAVAYLRLSHRTLTSVGDSRGRPILPEFCLTEDAHTNREPFTFH